MTRHAEMTDKELCDAISEEYPGLAREVMRRLNKPQPINVEQEAELDRLRKLCGH